MTSIRPLYRFADTYAIAWRARQDLARPILMLVVVFSFLQFGLIWGLIGSESSRANVLVPFVAYHLRIANWLSAKHRSPKQNPVTTRFSQYLRLRFGSPQAVLPPGTHSKLPFVQSVVAIDVYGWSSQFTSSAVSADGVPLETEVTYTYWVDDAIQNFVTLQGNAEFTDSSLAMLMQSVSSEVIATKSLATLNEDLLQINAELESRLSESASVFGVDISGVQLRVTELDGAQ